MGTETYEVRQGEMVYWMPVGVGEHGFVMAPYRWLVSTVPVDDHYVTHVRFEPCKKVKP